MNLRFTNIGLAALLLLGSSSVAFAADEEKSSADSTAIEFEELTPNDILMQEVSIIGSKFNIKNIAGSAAYLDVQDIRQHGVADVNRLLRRVPGINLRQEDGFGLFPNISLRGVDPSRSSKITIMEDGILTAPAPYSAPSAYYSPTSARMSGIEVLKGSSQVKYGPHTTGGAINFLSTPIPTAEKYYMKAAYGSFNEIRNQTYFGDTVQTDGGKLGYLIEYYTRSNTGFKELDTNTADVRNEANTGFDKQEPMIKLSYEPKSSSYQRFEFKMGYTNLDANETYLGLSTGDFINNPNRRYAASRFDQIESRHFRTHIRHYLELNKDTDLVTTVYGNTFHRNWQKLHELRNTTTNLSIALASTSGLAILKGEAAGTLRVRNNNRDYYLYGLESKLIHDMEIGETKHKVEVGVRLHYDQVRQNEVNEDFTQDANGSITAVSIGEQGGANNKLSETYATTLNVQDAIKWKKFTFTPGVRFEYLQQSHEQFEPKTVFNAQIDYGVITGGASLKYDMYDANGQDFDLFGGIHRGFSPPSPSSASTNGLREESSVGYELGARYKDAPKAFSTEAVLFLTNFSNLIVNDSVGGTGSGNTVNAGEVRTMGLELQANYDHGLAKNWAVQTPVYVAFTLTDATFREDLSSTDQESIFAGAKKGNDVPYIANEVLSFGWGLIYQKFSVSFDANYTSEVFADGSNLGVQVNPETNVADERFGKVDEQFVVDASLGYQINKKVRLFSTFKNITDSRYMVSRQPHGPRPGLPFSMMAGLEFDL